MTILDKKKDIIKPEGITKHFVAMKGKHQRLTAVRLCESIGSPLAQADTSQKKLELQSLLGKMRFHFAYAGIEMDRLTNEYVFKKTGAPVGFLFPNVKNLHNTNSDSDLTWKQVAENYPNF